MSEDVLDCQAMVETYPGKLLLCLIAGLSMRKPISKTPEYSGRKYSKPKVVLMGPLHLVKLELSVSSISMLEQRMSCCR